MKYRHGQWDAAPALHGCEGAAAARAVCGQYDLLIGSDLLYERDADGALAGFIARHAAPGAEVWIVDPDRGNQPPFNRHMAANGFLRREERIDCPAALGAEAYRGRLLTYQRK
jgi:hypothetical protein